MTVLETACAAIVLLWIAIALGRAARDESFAAVPGPPSRRTRRLLASLGLLGVAAWVSEDSVIHAYGFYGYAGSWRLVLDRTPILVAAIWPVVVLSARELARTLLREVPGGAGPGRDFRVPVLAAALVVTDAALIEPIAVASGLWSWTSPGPFDVPVIGVLGWGLFALGALAALEAFGGSARDLAGPVTALVGAPPATHLLLLLAWWGGLRWAPVPGEDLAIGLAWVTSFALTALALRRRLGARVPPAVLLARIPGALFFFVLLARRAEPRLVAYALAFVPPYLALLWRPRENP